VANGREPHLLSEPWRRGYPGTPVPVHKIFRPRNHGAVSSGACAQIERKAIPKIAESSMSSAPGLLSGTSYLFCYAAARDHRGAGPKGRPREFQPVRRRPSVPPFTIILAGDWVSIETPEGSVRTRAWLNDQLRRIGGRWLGRLVAGSLVGPSITRRSARSLVSGCRVGPCGRIRSRFS
jgi:hypothetical protein